MQSRAPEYSGSNELPPAKDPQTLAAVAGEPVPSASSSTAPPRPSAAPTEAAVPRLPGTPELTKDGLYVFTGGGIELAVDPHRGQIERLSLDGKSALASEQAGSDGDNFSAEVEGSSLLIKDAAGSLTKRFRLDTARRSVEVTYTLLNVSTKPTRVGALDAQRVPAGGGITFFPGSPKLLPGSTLKLNVWQPVIWFAHDQNRETTTVEAHVESSEGWVASVNDGMLLVKSFSDATKPTVSISCAFDAATKQHPWVEIVEQSQLVELAPGASVSANVRLFLRKLPPSIAAKPGNPELVGFVRGVIQ